MGISPIPWDDFESYSRLMGIDMNSWEARTLREIDLAVVSWARGEANRRQPGKPQPQQVVSESQPMTPKLFNSLFGKGKKE